MKRKSHRGADAQWQDGNSKSRATTDVKERKRPKNWYVVSTQPEDTDDEQAIDLFSFDEEYALEDDLEQA